MYVSEVWTFCELVSFYRDFMQDFARMARPLHNLTRENVRFNWDDNCEAAFLE